MKHGKLVIGITVAALSAVALIKALPGSSKRRPAELIQRWAPEGRGNSSRHLSVRADPAQMPKDDTVEFTLDCDNGALPAGIVVRGERQGVAASIESQTPYPPSRVVVLARVQIASGGNGLVRVTAQCGNEAGGLVEFVARDSSVAPSAPKPVGAQVTTQTTRSGSTSKIITMPAKE